jgi:hypothetical protein
MTKQPLWCSARNARRLSAILMILSCQGEDCTMPPTMPAIATWGPPFGITGKGKKNGAKHPSRPDIPTPTCDRLAVPFTLRTHRNSLSERHPDFVRRPPCRRFPSRFLLPPLQRLLPRRRMPRMPRRCANPRKLPRCPKLCGPIPIIGERIWCRAGPLYFGGVYLGDDPDPNIRFQLLRDISGAWVATPENTSGRRP